MRLAKRRASLLNGKGNLFSAVLRKDAAARAGRGARRAT